MKRTTLNKTRKTTELIPTEYDECLTLVEYLETQKKQGKVKLFTHVSNETYVKSPLVRRMHTLQGLRAGFPDYVVLTTKDILFIEMKRKRGGVVSPEQQEWIDALNSLGLSAKVCRGYDEAKEFIESDFEGA